MVSLTCMKSCTYLASQFAFEYIVTIFRVGVVESFQKTNQAFRPILHTNFYISGLKDVSL